VGKVLLGTTMEPAKRLGSEAEARLGRSLRPQSLSSTPSVRALRYHLPLVAPAVW